MNVSENISLAELNSFGVEAWAARLVEWETVDELRRMAGGGENAMLGGGIWMVLGGGNNILFTRDYAGTLVKSAAKNISVTAEDAKTLSMHVEAGVDWDEFVVRCVGRGVWGAENLSGIPGTVGACPIQNIGAYGAEAKDIISSVEYLDVATGALETIAAADCGFGYRDSVFKRDLKGRVVITAVNFTLSKEPRPNLGYAALTEKVESLGGVTLENIRRAVTEIRDSKLPDPRKTGNAGSFFKNPVVPAALAQSLAADYPGMPQYPAGNEARTGDVNARAARTKLAAGWLIEQAGWKGRSIGHVGVHPQQALIIINLGGATGREIIDFAGRIQADVKAKFGVELFMEVNIC